MIIKKFIDIKIVEYCLLLKRLLVINFNFMEARVRKRESNPLDPPEIVYRLKRAGWTVTRLAKESDVSRVTATLAISSGSSPKVRAKISQILGIPEQDLWPFRFQ